MQITANTTGMAAAVTLTADLDARDHCLVVIKGTFMADARGELQLAEEQAQVVSCDEHYGDPATSAVRFECEFALHKPRTDVLVVGTAIAPGGVPVERLPVRLELPGASKEVLVFGERQWVRAAGSLFPSPPVPFVEMPLTFDRAYGGIDDSAGSERVECELRNLAGVGFHARRPARAIEGLPVPNLEHPRHLVRAAKDRPPPIGFGVVSRTWLPRRSYAGTYDDHWLEHHAPYLPPDFDARFNQCAPEDQQLPPLRGGERFRCVHMSASGSVSYVMPSATLPVRFRFTGQDVQRVARLDTVILEPKQARVQLLWRCSVAVGKKPSDLREILIGERAAAPKATGTKGSKPRFRSLDDAVRSIAKRKGAGE